MTGCFGYHLKNCRGSYYDDRVLSPLVFYSSFGEKIGQNLWIYPFQEILRTLCDFFLIQ